jgi:hypothetical protein
MNAPLRSPIVPASNSPEIPDSSAPWWLDIVAELGRPRFVFASPTPDYPTGLEWGTAREQRNVSR